MTIVTRLQSALSCAWFRLHGVQVAPGCLLHRGVSLERGATRGVRGEIRLGRDCELGRGACVHAWAGRITLGARVFIGPYAVIYGHGGVEIGEATLVSMHCRILSSNHAVPPPGVDIRSQPDELLPTRIGRDVWIGAGATILGGVANGDGCVVAAGAVVTKNLPPYSIAMGVPATVVGTRK